MRKLLLAAPAAFALALPLQAQEVSDNPALSPNQIVESAAPEEWVAIPAEDLLVMTLAPDREGNPRNVVIQLMPAPFSQGWVENVRLLARSGYYDGLAVIRVQDNYVTQWGDPDAESEDAKPLPEGLKVMEEEEYVSSTENLLDTVAGQNSSDSYASHNWVRNGWPIAGDNEGRWPVHCYGMVGVARDLSPNTGDGTSLYTVVGHAPRHLDRNIALVGRVIEGMEHLSSLPRGKGELGFYENKAEQTPILFVKVASDVEQFPQPTYEYLSTESESFARYAEARANRRDPFFIHPAGGADICNIPVPVRRVVTD